MFFPKTSVAFSSDLMIPTVGDYKSLPLVFLFFFFLVLYLVFLGFVGRGFFRLRTEGEGLVILT